MLEAIAPALVERAERSEQVRKAFIETLLPRIEPLLEDRRVCLYTTGSYGRREAWVDAEGKSGSDIDLFILDAAIADPIGGLAKIRLQAQLVETATSFGFPRVRRRREVPRGPSPR